MRTIRAKHWSRVASVIAAVSLLSGCDGGESTPAPTPSPTPSATPTPTTPDVSAPNAPPAIALESFAHNQVKLYWAAATDDRGVVKYAILRSDKPDDLAVVAGVSYTDDSATPITAYTYKVVAIDAAGNRSTASPGLDVTTLSTPTANCPTTTLDYPGQGGTGQAVGFQGSEASLTPVGPDNVPAGARWEPSTGMLEVTGRDVHLTDVIVRGGIHVTGPGVFTLTNSVVEFRKTDQNFECWGNRVNSVSQCRLTGNTFRKTSNVAGGEVISVDTGVMTARCNYLVNISLRYSQAGGPAGARVPVDYNWLSGGTLLGYNSRLNITHNRADLLRAESVGGNSDFVVDGNYFGGALYRSLYLAGAVPTFRNNAVARPGDGGPYCEMSNTWRSSVTEASNNFVGDALGNRTAVAFNFPNECRWFDP